MLAGVGRRHRHCLRTRDVRWFVAAICRREQAVSRPVETKALKGQKRRQARHVYSKIQSQPTKLRLGAA
jgi:hypothetical protein